MLYDAVYCLYICSKCLPEVAQELVEQMVLILVIVKKSPHIIKIVSDGKAN